MQYDAMRCDAIRYDTIRYDIIRYDMATRRHDDMLAWHALHKCRRPVGHLYVYICAYVDVHDGPAAVCLWLQGIG